MDARYYTIATCLLILAGSLHAKQKDDKKIRDSDMGNDNNAGREHFPAKTSEMIDIDDDPPQSDVYMGSGDQLVDDDYSGYGLDDEDLEGSAGPNIDDEDDMQGSGAGMYKSPCQKLKADIDTHQVVGAYVPECTEDGGFKRKQCFKPTKECWCVDEMGREIASTKRRFPEEPICENMHPEVINRKPPQNRPDRTPAPSEPEEEPIPESKEENEIDNRIDNMPGVDSSVEIQTVPPETNDVEMLESKGRNMLTSNAVMTQPGILAGIIGGAVVGLLCAVLLVMFIVYRMRKKDEGSYALDEPRRSPSLHTYSRATNREFYA